ncbi:MAG: transcription elongation factor Spt5 [Candidatus Aenigmatarchaeota archaeon]
MIASIRTTTGRENIVIDSISSKINSKKIPIKSVFHPEDLSGYIFIEADSAESIEEAVKNVPHVRGTVSRDVKLEELEKFIIPEKRTITIDVGDIVDVITGPFKGERAKITRVDEVKGDVTLELMEAVIPIPITISVNSIKIYEKKKD